MNYGKKVLVLSQVADGFAATGKRISAILRIETEGSVSTLYFSAVNAAVKTDGKFLLSVMDKKKKLYSFSLGNRPATLTCEFDFPKDITDGFAAGVCYIKDGIPVLIAYSDCDGLPFTKSEFKKAVLSKCMTDFKKEAPPFTENGLLSEDKIEKEITPSVFSLPPAEKENGEYAPPAEYDDEAVATENFYTLDESISEKLKILESMENVGSQNILRDSESEKGTEKSAADDCGNQFKGGNELGFSAKNPFIDTKRAELDGLFFKFPEDDSLSKIIPESRFVKIHYSAEKYYVVGVVKENGAEKYICYGVPAKYSAKPPKELKGFCSFIPRSYFDMKGDGFWMMFQSAITGECVKPK